MQVDVDETKVDLFGHEIMDENLSSDDWAKIYRETDHKIETHLRKGDSVVDASRYFRLSERNHARRIGERTGTQVVVVYIDTPELLCRQRRLENRRKQTRCDISDQDFEDTISAMEPPSGEERALVFHHDNDMGRWISLHSKQLD